MHRFWPVLVLVGSIGLAGCRSYQLVGDDWLWDEPEASFASGHGGGGGEAGAAAMAHDDEDRANRQEHRRDRSAPAADPMVSEQPEAAVAVSDPETESKPVAQQETQSTSPTDPSEKSVQDTSAVVDTAPAKSAGPSLDSPEVGLHFRTPESASTLVDASTPPHAERATRQPAELEIPQRMPAAGEPGARVELFEARDGAPQTEIPLTGQPSLPVPKSLLLSEDSQDAMALKPTGTTLDPNHEPSVSLSARSGVPAATGNATTGTTVPVPAGRGGDALPTTATTRVIPVGGDSSPRLRGEDQGEGASHALAPGKSFSLSKSDGPQTPNLIFGESQPGESGPSEQPSLNVNERIGAPDARPLPRSSLSLPKAWLASEKPAAAGPDLTASPAGPQVERSSWTPMDLEVQRQSPGAASTGSGTQLPDVRGAVPRDAEVSDGSVALGSPAAHPGAPSVAGTPVPLPATEETVKSPAATGTEKSVAIDPLLSDDAVETDWRAAQLQREAAVRKVQDQSRNELRRRLYRFLFGRDAPAAD